MICWLFKSLSAVDSSLANQKEQSQLIFENDFFRMSDIPVFLKEQTEIIMLQKVEVEKLLRTKDKNIPIILTEELVKKLCPLYNRQYDLLIYFNQPMYTISKNCNFIKDLQNYDANYYFENQHDLMIIKQDFNQNYYFENKNGLVTMRIKEENIVEDLGILNKQKVGFYDSIRIKSIQYQNESIVICFETLLKNKSTKKENYFVLSEYIAKVYRTSIIETGFGTNKSVDYQNMEKILSYESNIKSKYKQDIERVINDK